VSSTAVRQAVDTFLSGPEWNDTLMPYYSSANASYPEPEDVDQLSSWVTAQYDVYNRPRFCVGPNNGRETGAWTLVLMGQAFSGTILTPEVVWPIAESAIAAHVWPDGMRCAPAIPPQPDTYTPGDRWQRWDIVVPYQYDTEG